MLEILEGKKRENVLMEAQASGVALNSGQVTGER